MANYHTEAFFIVPLSTQKVARSLKLIACIQDDKRETKLDNNTEESYCQADIDFSKQFIKATEPNCQGQFDIGFNASESEDGLAIFHDKTINTGKAAEFVHQLLAYFDLDIGISLNASHCCSESRADAYGGHAAFITKADIKWMSTSDWLDEQAHKHSAQNI